MIPGVHRSNNSSSNGALIDSSVTISPSNVVVNAMASSGVVVSPSSSSSRRSSLTSPSVSPRRRGRKVLVVRHGERVDFTFNPTHEDWVLKTFDHDGQYKRLNINMPRSLPLRHDGYLNYVNDTPLTEMGYLQAKLTGRALKDASFKPTYIYASPAYRSIQTAVGIIKGLTAAEGKLKINVEIGLFEWGNWFQSGLPNWLQIDELIDFGYPINPAYKSILGKSDISPNESLLQYYNRSFAVVKQILDRHPEDCIIALVAHGASLDTCTRQITGGIPRELQDFYTLLHQTPYLAVAAMSEETVTTSVDALVGPSRRWRLIEPPILPFQHQGNASYDWKHLTLDKIRGQMTGTTFL